MGETRDDDHLPPFGDEAHRVLARARAAAYRLRHAALGTEHLLIGCVEETRGQAAELLYRAGISGKDVVDRVRLLTQRANEPPAELLMAPSLRTALRMAREEAARFRDSQVRSEHLLLAILRENTDGGAVVLRATGLDPRLARAAATRQRFGPPTRKARAPWIATGPYRVFALLGALSVVAAVAFAVRWLVTVRPIVRSAYLFDLLIPVALLGVGMVAIGASRMEAIRQASAREAWLAQWAAQAPAARVSEASALARAGAMAQAAPLLKAAVDRPMPDADDRDARAALARWLTDEQLAPHGYFARGLLRLHAGEMRAGLGDLERALRHRPEDAHWHDLYAVWLARAGHDDAALPLLHVAVERQPPEPLALVACATLLLRRGEPHAAQPLARHAAKALPSSSRPPALLAVAQSLQGDQTGAQTSLRQALALDPYDHLACALQAAALVHGGSPAEALTALHDVASATIERPGYLAAIEAWALSVLGREQESRLAASQARQRDPGLIATLTRMGSGLRAARLDQAEQTVSGLLARLVS